MSNENGSEAPLVAVPVGNIYHVHAGVEYTDSFACGRVRAVDEAEAKELFVREYVLESGKKIDVAAVSKCERDRELEGIPSRVLEVGQMIGAVPMILTREDVEAREARGDGSLNLAALIPTNAQLN